MGRAPPRRPLGQSTLGRRGLRRPRQACPCSSPKASLPRAMGPTPRRRDGVGARARARAAAQGRAPQGAVRRVPAGTPENRARPPREGPAGVSGLPPPREGKQGGWGTEAWNPVTWSSSGQIVLCETGEKGPLGGPAAALSPRVSGARLVPGPGAAASLRRLHQLLSSPTACSVMGTTRSLAHL